MRLSDSYQISATETRTLIDELLDTQARLTAVEQFALEHDQRRLVTGRYRRLLPAHAPSNGQQYAFEVNVDQCSGCKACVTACHALNGLDEGEAWREVATLVSQDWRMPLRQAITSACHHCVDPACSNGCPVMAYEKDGTTGIVRHLDDQCIGCQYCVMMCPYEVPKYSEARGIVRKCDMCSQRLALNEPPACVQACPNEAIGIVLVNKQEVDGSACNLPHLADGAITLPSTRYVSQKGLPAEAQPSHEPAVAQQPTHTPLVLMLVLTQMGVGALAAANFATAGMQLKLALAAVLSLSAGILASVAHLGRPMKAWRAFLGLRTSWLSREIIGFSIVLPLAMLSCWWLWREGPASNGILAVATFAGLLAVWCSGMIYHVTRRPFWTGQGSIGKFFGTAGLMGMGLGWGSALLAGAPAGSWVTALVLFASLKLAIELREANYTVTPDELFQPDFAQWSLGQTARLLQGELGLVLRMRLVCLVAGGALLPCFSLLTTSGAMTLVPLSVSLLLAGEFAERFLFFRAVGSLKR